MKIIIIANCQVLPLIKGLSFLTDVKYTLGLPIHLFGTKHFDKPKESFDELVKEDDFIILTFNNSAQFGEFATTKLKETYKNVITMTNIYFSGLHPDITYIGDRSGRISSSIGDYHSKIIIHSYMTGKSTDDCLALFNGANYKKLGFYSEYANSTSALLERDKENNITFGKYFMTLLKERPSLYTVNHPTPYIFQEYLCVIAEYLGIRTQRLPLEMLPNYLANSAWWPVYPEIAEQHSLNYQMPMVFKQPEAMGGKIMSLNEFVAHSYDLYNKSKERLYNSRQVVALMDTWGN